MASKSNAGIQTAADGSTYIPASKRADGSVRKEIKVRPGFKPTEDIATYKTPTTAALKAQLGGGVPGAEIADALSSPNGEPKSKNAKRREAARRKAAAGPGDDDLTTSMDKTSLVTLGKDGKNSHDVSKPSEGEMTNDEDAERQKKVRNTLKKLKAVRELKEKKVAGAKLSPDQLIKVSKEDELLKDLRKLGYSEETAETTIKAEADSG